MAQFQGSVVGAKVFRVRATAVFPRLSSFFGPSSAFVDISWHIRHQREGEILYNVAQKRAVHCTLPCVRMYSGVVGGGIRRFCFPSVSQLAEVIPGRGKRFNHILSLRTHFNSTTKNKISNLG